MLQVDPVKEELLETDENFRRLFEEHRQYKQRLAMIRQKSLPSPDDEIEMKRIKVSKLHLKDQMEGILRDYRRHHATA